MAKTDLSKMSLKELKALRAEVDKAIAGFEKKKLEEAKREMEAVAKKHGVSVSEVLGGSSRKSSKSKAPAKFKNPEDPSQTWSGRGRQPEWFKAGLANGKSPDDMAA